MVEGHETFPRAPIEEAVIEFRVSRPEAPLAVLDGFMAALEQDYPERRPKMGFHASFTIPAIGRPEPAPPVWEWERQPTGWLLRNSGRPYAVQVGLDAVSVSRLKPYTTWEDLVAEARRVWVAYTNTTAPAEVTRLGARYVNRFAIRLEKDQPISDWLQSYPARGELLPQGLVEFGLRAVVAREDRRAFAVLTQALDQSDATGRSGVLLDIDAFAQVALAPTDDAIWSELASLRDLKNRVFLGSITTKTRELFR